MSSTDTMMPLVSAPWLDTAGIPLSVAPVPGLRSEVIDGLPSCPNRELRELLQMCSGLAGTQLGSIDFTGCLFPSEPLGVFHPCITLAIDDVGRRWLAETCPGPGLSGPVWCVFPDPQVAVYVSDDLKAFIGTVRDCAARGATLPWIRDLAAQAKVVWALRHDLSLRSYEACRSDDALQGWLSGLPFDARVYDLRRRAPARGWPYGLAGPGGRLYRCGRLPVFAVSGWPTGSRWAEDPAETLPHSPLPYLAGAEIPLVRPPSELPHPGTPFPRADRRPARRSHRDASPAGLPRCA